VQRDRIREAARDEAAREVLHKRLLKHEETVVSDDCSTFHLSESEL
jgi:hypothetical protein